MRLHLDVLGWLHTLGGAFGVVTGASLMVLAFGTFVAQGSLGWPSATAPSVVWTLGACAAVFLVGGGAMIATGRALLARRGSGRPAALWVAVVNLVVLPFGTALGIYTFWALLNDDARREFGCRPRGPGSEGPESS
jgi:hypothetical protein